MHLQVCTKPWDSSWEILCTLTVSQEQISWTLSRFSADSLMLCSWMCLGIILFRKPDPHGKDIKISLLPWYPRRWKGLSDFNMLYFRWEGKEKPSLEIQTFGRATNSSGVKSPSPSKSRCPGAPRVCLFIHVSSGICTGFQAYNPSLSLALLFQLKGKLLRSVHWWVLAFEWALDRGLKRSHSFLGVG